MLGWLVVTFGLYALAWSVPGTIMSAMVALGDPQRIAFIDSQLSKDVNKLHANFQCMLSAHIATRLFGYWLAYPFIRSRSTTDSTKFSLFMWINSAGMWSWILALTFAVLDKTL